MFDPQAVLLQAIVGKWSSSASLAAINGPWLHRKPPRHSSATRYAVIDPQTTMDRGWSALNQYYLTSVQFNLYNTTAELARVDAELVLAIFADEDLVMSFSSGGMVSHRLTASRYLEAESNTSALSELKFNFQTWLPR